MESDSFGATVLNIYGQSHWHSDAWIRGGRYALVQLRAAVDAALSDGQSEFNAFCSDGEAYAVKVILLSDEAAEQQQVPYTNIF